MQRVLFVSPQPFFQSRGSPIRVGFDVRALAESGFAVDLLTLPIGDDRAIPGVRVIRVANPFRRRDIPIGPSVWKLGYDALLLARGLRLATRGRYVAVHAVEDAGPAGWLIARRCGARFIFEKHSDPDSYRKGLLRNLLMRAYAAVEGWTVRRADAVICTGESLVAQARAAGGRGSIHHIFDIPSSLEEPDVAATAAARAGWGLPPESVVALYVGSFAVYQGIDLLFEALARALREEPRLAAVIIGGSAEQIAGRRAWLAGRGLADRVRFPGFIDPDALPSSLRAADILLSPRIAGRNTPLKLLDYLKVGRPVVATDNAANRLILSDATAVLVETTPEAFADGLLALARDPARRARLGGAARRVIDERYTYAEFKRRLAACYAAAGVSV